LDATNLRLLAELGADPRISMSELARRVSMSAPAVSERVQRLEQSGVIAGYRLDLDPAAIGLPVTAFVRLRPDSGQVPAFAAYVGTVPQVVECYRITGEDCYLVRVQVAGVDRLAALLDGFQVFGVSTTSVVVDTLVPTRSAGLPEPEPAE
jgi:Lrp/AsnC family leucine-responsive transcriptional regulator